MFYDTFMEDVFILFLLRKRAQRQKYLNKHSRYQKRYYNRLDLVQRRLRSRKIPRVALHHPSVSAWRQLYVSRNDQGFITLTGLDVATFEWLSAIFSPVYDHFSPFISEDGTIVPKLQQKGRDRLLQGKDCLALALAWTRTKGSNMILQLVFGISHTSTSMYLRFGRRILIEILCRHPMARVKIPPVEKISEYCDAIASRHPMLPNVWCTMDGLKLSLQQSSVTSIQSRFYNGWTQIIM